MASSQTKACLRCHSKKIKCSGYPDCSTCRQADIRCEVYVRPRRHESSQLREAHSRIKWLEDEVERKLGLACASMPTGTPLSTLHRSDDGQRLQFQSAETRNLANSSTSTPRSVMSNAVETAVVNDASDASLLTLNASGELRYLGASSGAFFASCAAAFIRSSSNQQDRTAPQAERAGHHTAGMVPESNVSINVGDDELMLLLRSYEMWVHPLYPLLDLEALRDLVARHKNELSKGAPSVNTPPGMQRTETTIALVVLALGATNRSNTIKQLHLERDNLLDRVSSTHSSSAEILCAAALRHLRLCLDDIRSSLLCIQMLLLFCVYSSYGPVGASQWQLAGLAIRMAVEIGLHHDPKRWYVSEQDVDQRRRVFWTAYAIEVTLAYNLGRPPSISLEQITTKLPNDAPDIQLGILNMKHRQIQGKIMSRMYQVSSREDVTWDQRQGLIAELQVNLDEWRTSIPRADGGVTSPHPSCYWDRLYHSTTFVLHRIGTLCLEPSMDSLNRCIRAAGAYIDSVVRVLRTSNVPQSWMLIQGVISAGLTMLITARANFKQLDWALLLVDLASWSRKCSVCLAIMNERWHEDLLSKLESQLETLADNTLKYISNGLAAQRRGTGNPNIAFDGTSFNADHTSGTSPPISAPFDVHNEAPMTEWEPLTVFDEFVGTDFMNAYWDMYGLEGAIPSNLPGSDAEGASTSF